MAKLYIPRVRAADAIADQNGKATNPFVQFWDKVCRAIEGQEASQDSTIATIAQLQAQQQAQLAMINEALVLAGIAIELTGGNFGSNISEVDLVFPGWVLGPVVNLTGVVAGNLTILSSGLVSKPATSSAYGEFAGEIRLVEIVGGVDTVVGGPWATSVSRVDVNPAGTVYVTNPAEIGTFTAARTTTGAVSYRIDSRMVDSDVLNVDIKLYARRTT